MWLEQLARGTTVREAYPVPFTDGELDFRPLLKVMAQERKRGRDVKEIARCFQRGIAQGLSDAVTAISRRSGLDTVVLSGGVFQNELLLEDLKSLLADGPLEIWTNHAVPPNDGGISLGQAALAAFDSFNNTARTHHG